MGVDCLNSDKNSLIASTAVASLDGLKSFIAIDLVTSMITTTPLIVWTSLFYLPTSSFSILMLLFSSAMISLMSCNFFSSILIIITIPPFSHIYLSFDITSLFDTAKIWLKSNEIFTFDKLNIFKMELVNMIGHMQHWGLTPAANLLHHYPFPSHPERPLRILISGTSDIRHILKTLCDIN